VTFDAGACLKRSETFKKKQVLAHFLKIS